MAWRGSELWRGVVGREYVLVSDDKGEKREPNPRFSPVDYVIGVQETRHQSAIGAIPGETGILLPNNQRQHRTWTQ